MARRAAIPHHDEALVLRTWPFHEADLLVSVFTREQGVVKGVARHAMRSRRRFGGALEPGTVVTAHYAERPREDLVRLDSFEILWSPLRAPMHWLRMAGMQLVLEIVEQTLPEQAPEDNVYRLAVTTLQAMEEAAGPRAQGSGLRAASTGLRAPGLREGRGTLEEETGSEGAVWVAVTYFCVWMCRLMGWWPELGVCSACGLDLHGERVWWSASADGVTCRDDRRAGSRGLPAEAVGESARMARRGLGDMLMQEPWTAERGIALFRDLGSFALAMLERHLQRRIQSASALRSGEANAASPGER